VRNNSPLVRALFAEIKRRKLHLTVISRQVGMSSAAVGRWRDVNPTLENFEAAWNLLGYTLIPVKMEDRDALVAGGPLDHVKPRPVVGDGQPEGTKGMATAP